MHFSFIASSSPPLTSPECIIGCRNKKKRIKSKVWFVAEGNVLKYQNRISLRLIVSLLNQKLWCLTRKTHSYCSKFNMTTLKSEWQTKRKKKYWDKVKSHRKKPSLKLNFTEKGKAHQTKQIIQTRRKTCYGNQILWNYIDAVFRHLIIKFLW